MVAMFIVSRVARAMARNRHLPFRVQGAIGVLDRTDMDHFATIFVAYQKRGKSNDPDGMSDSSFVRLW